MSDPDRLPDRIASTCWDVFGDTAPSLVVAVSGGPDSAALAHLLVTIGRYPVRLAYLNHGIRSEDEQRREHAAVEALAERLSVPLVTSELEHGMILSGPNRGEVGLEGAARRERYRFLTRTALAFRSVLVTAHHRDDQAETVLLQLLSGRSLTGNALGMKIDGSMMSDGGETCRVLRPALDVARSDLRGWSDDHGLPYGIDSSNVDRQFRRNRLRAEVMPVLEAFYPDATEAFSRLAREVGDLRTAVDALLPPGIVRDRGDDGLGIDYRQFCSLPPAARAVVLRRTVQCVSTRTRIHTAPLDRLIASPEKPPHGGAIRLADVEVLMEPSEIRVRRVVRKVETGYLFTVRGATILGFREGTIRAYTASETPSASGAHSIGPIEAPLVVRSIHPGDTVVRDGRARSVREVIGKTNEIERANRYSPAILEDRRGILGIAWYGTIEVLRDGAVLVSDEVERPGFSPPLYLECEDDSLYAE